LEELGIAFCFLLILGIRILLGPNKRNCNSTKYNPTRKLDYIQKWVPKLANLDAASIRAPWENRIGVAGYPGPIVDYKFVMKRASDATGKYEDKNRQISIVEVRKLM